MSFLASALVLPPPKSWRELADCPVDGARAFESRDGGLRVIASRDVIAGKAWLHISMSRRRRMPTYDDLATVRRVFVGDQLSAYQVFPPRVEHVNVHEFCLHLWAPLDGDPFPDLGARQ